MPVRIVQSKQNARLKQLRRALDQPLRERDREGRALAGIEGPNLSKKPCAQACASIACFWLKALSDCLMHSLWTRKLKS